MTHVETRREWLNSRYSGVLAHVTSLPSNYGIGNFGSGAREFIDFLGQHGFTFWQICPLGPTGYGDSPYQSFSSFAGNPYLIDLDRLVEAGYIDPQWLEPLKALPKDGVDFGKIYQIFWNVMALAKERYDLDPRPLGSQSLEDFVGAESAWLDPYSTFMALKQLHGGRPWPEWSSEYRCWKQVRGGTLPEETKREKALHEWLQYCFYQHWNDLKWYAGERGIQIIGDIPIFVSYDSSDCWQNPEYFTLDENGSQLEVAGVPPDYFSEDGQLWGNPLYRWDKMESEQFAWWINRVRLSLRLYDVIRLDHFRGFDTYWAIPGGAKTARGGQWREAPGRAFFNQLFKEMPDVKIIAEDLGYITEGVYQLRMENRLPGMKILQFGIGHDEVSVNLPHCFERNSVVYTGTHDNDSTRGWLSSLGEDERRRVRSYFDTDDSNSAWPMIRSAFASVCNLAVIPLQDLMDLPSSSRFNLPGTASGNWKWRYESHQLERLIEKRGEQILYWQKLYNRTGKAINMDYSPCPEDAN
jgi:4-alpha-glucanotransferase